jgi:HD-GYP domain-containing protein (c-di-GMP phosphodiesterase class II)
LRDGDDLPQQLARLAAHLRDAPMSEEGKSLFDAAAEALDSLSEDVLTNDRVMCLLFVSRHAYYSGNAFLGLDPARKAVAFAKRIGDEALRARALKTLGIIYLETGSYPDTVSTLAAALESAHACADRLQEVEILTNLGLAHQYAGHFGTAVPCFERAVELAEEARIAPIARATALGNMVLAHLHLRQFALGQAAAEHATALLDRPANAHERTVRCTVECYYARVLLEVGEFAHARARISLAHEHAVGSGELAQLLVEMAQGLVEVYEPATRDIGLSRLQRSVHQSRKGAPGALRDALAMIVRGYEIAGQPNAALVYLHEAMQLNGDHRVRNVLTHHRLHLSKVTEALDRRAHDIIDARRSELRFQRVPMDVLRDCMLVLEKNTVAAELHDDDTGEHCYRMGALAKELARRLGMDDDMANLIDLSARLHDIGKLRVPDSILLKPGRLNPDERTIMQMHCVYGWDLIGQGGLAQLFVAQEIALNHHERWDGTGYPNRRSGSLIPLAARITTIVDVFDALTHRRCYKEAWSIDQALGEIASLSGSQFDPQLADVFLNMVPELQARHSDLDAYLGAEARRNNFIADRARVANELKQNLQGLKPKA